MARHPLTWVVIFGVIAMMFVQLPRKAAEQDAVINTYSALVEVDALAKQNYVEPIGESRLVHGAIRGMMRELDPYSGYIPEPELPGFERLVRGEYDGIGVEIGMQDGHLAVIAPIDGGPAAAAGVAAGDRIVAIDDRDLDPNATSVVDVEELLSGRPGSTVRLKLHRPGRPNPLHIEIARGPVTIETVRGWRRGADGWDFVLDPAAKLGYVRVTNFHENTIEQFDRALKELRERGIARLILDLRFNPGGLLHQAVAMVDRFLAEGVIVSTVTRRSAVEHYAATGKGSAVGLGLAILVNEASASASEIVAGSLQDHGRAVVVGVRTFGKGSVQHLIHLRGGRAAIKLTVAYYKLPKGRIIHRHPRRRDVEAWGVSPDVDVELTSEETEALIAARRLVDVHSTGERDSADPVSAPQIHTDRQLVAAIDALQAPSPQEARVAP